MCIFPPQGITIILKLEASLPSVPTVTKIHRAIKEQRIYYIFKLYIKDCTPYISCFFFSPSAVCFYLVPLLSFTDYKSNICLAEKPESQSHTALLRGTPRAEAVPRLFLQPSATWQSWTHTSSPLTTLSRERPKELQEMPSPGYSHSSPARPENKKLVDLLHPRTITLPSQRKECSGTCCFENRAQSYFTPASSGIKLAPHDTPE